MQITAIATGFEGLTLLQPKVFRDLRGSFVKTFHEDVFRQQGLSFTPREEFYTTSDLGVLRGMHFQRPPAAHSKLVYCTSGRVLDVVLDLRIGSPTCGQYYARELSSDNLEQIFISPGFAHGFLALADKSTMVYLTDIVHTPACDTGVHWDSFGFRWPVITPTISDRDRQLPPWRMEESPFQFTR